MAVVLCNYELLDFGQGRKLERFGPNFVDRPCPAAEGIPQASPMLWKRATVRFRLGPDNRMQWMPAGGQPWEEPLALFRAHDPFRLELALQPLPSGQVGVFPEQAENWQWIYERVRAAGRPLRVLNLFAYTGASTIAAAAAGADVTHVDAATSVVGRASVNAEYSGLAEASIRWIVDDAVKFCRREVRRSRRYDAVILDPPTYGHGKKKGEVWQIQRDLPRLLRLCLELTGESPRFVLLTSHTTGIDSAELAVHLEDAGFACRAAEVEQGAMQLRATDRRELPSGVFARYDA